MQIWDLVLSSLREKVSKQNFNIWFRPTVAISADNDRKCLLIRVPNEHFQYWLTENYSDLIQLALGDQGYGEWTCSFSVRGRDEESGLEALEKGVDEVTTCAQTEECNLSSRYTFGRFVVGASNQFAHAAALAVAEQPSKAYNPLFIYGGVGLGKTHLMHAVGHYIKIRQPKIRLTYMSSEHFMNELINSIRYDRTIQFRDKYRNIDVLLMDDIQFLAGKERTQEEFFHTFNALYDAQKQIIITSDCAPRKIPTLEERLHSRFEWGLIADIQPPDLETKIAILRKKAELEKVDLPDEVVFFIAQNIRSNVRELEGSLIRLAAYSSLTGEAITLSLAETVLRNIAEQTTKITTVRDIQEIVARHFSLSPADLRAKGNARSIAGPRQIAMYLARDLTESSLPQIGKAFGGKHHTTVLHSVRKIAKMAEQDPGTRALLKRLSDSIN
jgi:chromosomal replication initiator protein